MTFTFDDNENVRMNNDRVRNVYVQNILTLYVSYNVVILSIATLSEYFTLFH